MLTVDRMALARAIRHDVLAVPGVAGISPGGRSESATYGVGERVRGIAVTREEDRVRVAVHIVAEFTAATDLQALASGARSAARGAVEGLVPGAPAVIDVVIDDITLQGGSL